MKLRYIIPVSLITIFLVSACELPRPGGENGNIAPDIPVVTNPGVTPAPPGETPAAGQPPAAGETPPPVVPAGIEPNGVPAVQAPQTEFVEGNVLVKLNPQAAIQARSAELGPNGVVSADIPTFDQILADIGADKLEPVIAEIVEATNDNIESFSAQTGEVSQLYSINYTSAEDPVAVAQRLTQDPAVEYAEPNYIAGITAGPVEIPVQLIPNDQYYSYQWNLNNIQMPAAWDQSNGAGVIVGVVDTGIDFNAPDLIGADRMPGFDFINNDSDPTDDQGHGTHVAGTIAQRTNNEIGVAGVAYGARLLPVKVLGASGEGSYEGVIKGIIYAVDQGAKVINMSLAGRNDSASLRDAIDYAHNRGVVVVAAAGNSGSSVEFPAAYDAVIAVGATDYNNIITSYSNFGSQIDIMAPGGDISADNNGDHFGDGILQNTLSSTGEGYSYRFFEGTSMASPHVAGVAALLFSIKPNASPDEIKTVIMQTADNNPNIGPVGQFGAGLVQAANAIAAISGTTGQPTATDTPTPTPTTETPTDTPTPTATSEPIGEHDGDLITDTPTPTETPTPTGTAVTPAPGPTTPAPPPQAGELLTNGSFETDEGWVFGDTPIHGEYSTNTVHSGSRAVLLGTLSGPDRFSYTSIWQRVTIPAEAQRVMLEAYINPISQDSPGTDAQNIMILNENFYVIKTLSSGLSNSQTWEQRTYDLSDLAGRTVYIYFSVVNLGDGRPSAMYVDDVSLRWSP